MPLGTRAFRSFLSQELLLLLVNPAKACDKVYLGWRNDLGFVNEFVSPPEDQEYGNGNITPAKKGEPQTLGMEETGTHVMKLATFHGMKVSNPLKKVMIKVETNASQFPHGWNGALYGRSSREIPCALSPRMNCLTDL
jgi:hypothetical protein